MDTKSKEEIRAIICKYMQGIHNRHLELSKRINDHLEENLDYMQQLFTQYSQPTSDAVITKTPRILRKRETKQRIETIPENDVFHQDDTSSHTTEDINQEEEETTEIVGGRSKRLASRKAASNIRKQSSIALREKLKRPASSEDHVSAKKEKRESHIKRKKSITNNSDEEDDKRSTKYSKLDENSLHKESAKKRSKNKSNQIDQSMKEIDEKIEKCDTFSKSKNSNKSRSTELNNMEVKENDDIVAPANNAVNEQSMYEDAIGKPTPLMNSTLKHSSVLPERVLNTTVILEPSSKAKKLNETIIIKKASRERDSKETKGRNSNKALPDSMHSHKEVIRDNYNGLITDDESSPDRKEPNKKIAKNRASKKQRVKSISSDDEIPNTPLKMHLKGAVIIPLQDRIQEVKNIYKPNALFSPYAKESVKKRVEAFEQAVMSGPNLSDVDAPTRLTRTKTRAMAAAEAKEQTKQPNKVISQARKSPAKAQKIPIAKQKDNEEFKENKEQLPERINKTHLIDKTNSKQIQQLKTTPSSKIKMQLPVSINRLLQNSSNTLLNQPRGLTASRMNIITNVDSFIQPPKSVTKTNSAEKLEDKKRYEEDARKKRDEGLRLMTEEKRRKREEKELKNRLAREAKEKQDLEKRQKMEREREEKAKLALLMQEKQREEIEKKRLAQLQRAQEKEERRKLEEQLKLQKLQEQEEAERLLAAQRRREQEAERRKEAEVRAQQQAAAEAVRQKHQMLTAQAKYKQANNKHQGTNNYVLDSEPDDDESDDENSPKHEIPHWAQPQIRKLQLAMQRYIPQEIVYKFFDTRKCTPDLTELFHGIDRNRLKRTSSAIWKTPPRYSMMEAE